jgi:flavin-dependent dehydrogenase
MGGTYHAIVVGARCAGAPTAMLLARKGYRVLIVDRAQFPSDTVSTHLIHAPGVAALGRWELLDRVVATGCPPIDSYALDFGPFTIAGTPRPLNGNSTAYAPRRTLLDKILVDAAAETGAEVREGFTVDEVLVEDGTVVGIVGRTDQGHVVVERALAVVGADGSNSRVARRVQSAQYYNKPVLQWSSYTYWSGLPVRGMEIVVRPDRGWGLFPTNDDLTLLVLGWPAAESRAYRADIEGNYLKTLELVPEVADRVRAAKREKRFTFGGAPNFFRKPFGPGWALVGDAGYTKDPITAQGISDAFRDAELCATGLDETFSGRRTFEDAMGDYQRLRDAQVRPLYEFTTELATLEPPPPEVQQLLGSIVANQEAMDAFTGVIAGTVSPVEFFAPDHIQRLVQAAAPA